MSKSHLFAIAVLSASCSQGVNTSPSAPIATPPTTTVFKGVFTVDGASGRVAVFDVPSLGTLTITVDWTHDTNNVVIALTTDECHRLYAALQGVCSNLGSPEIAPRKPKFMSVQISAATTVVLWVANLGATPESGIVEARLTPPGGVVPRAPPTVPVVPPTPTPAPYPPRSDR